MDRTVPSFRIATEVDKSRRRSFRTALGKKDRKKFDEMFDYSKLYNSADSNACKPVLSHVNLLSIL